MSARAVATASDAHAAEAATSLLTRGNAVDAVIAGVFAAAAASPSVLLGPVQILLGGAGLGLRAIDGRTQQPGRGVARPRGFTSAAEIAPASRVGVPALPAALASTLATSGASTLNQVMAPALAIATDVRKSVLKRILQRGPAALADDFIASELVAVAGRIAGGVLTKEDLDELRPPYLTCEMHDLPEGVRRAAFVPWRADAILGSGGPEGPLDTTRTRIVAAADHKGLLAIACYEVHEMGLPIPELDLVAPFTAAPVLRGEPRVRPGEPRPSAAPIAISEFQGMMDLALAFTGTREGEIALGRVLAKLAAGELLDISTSISEGAGISEGARGAGAILGVLRTRSTASLVRSARVE
jgi:hypothetical protein